MTTSSNPHLPEGHVLTGKWNKRTYRIIRLIGEGANGAVYLVEREGCRYALKTGFDPVDLQSEINALQTVAPQEPGRVGIRLLDADDVLYRQREIPFYVMPYLEGVPLHHYLARYGNTWLPVIMTRILQQLSCFHEKRYAFGDLKEENVLVGRYGMAELVDYGGVTAFGRAIRQFTEKYDRGYWRAGPRSADAEYDLFSAAALFIRMLLPEGEFERLCRQTDRNVQQMLYKVQNLEGARSLAPFLRKALTGGYASSGQALTDFRRIVPDLSQPAEGAKRWPWLETAFTASLLFSAAALYLLIRNL